VSAYELYLLGKHQQLQRNPDALTRAVEYHRRAIKADPRFALAHAGLADAYMAGYYYQNRSLEETAPLVQREVDAALRLDPQLPEAYAAWAVLLTEQFRFGEAVTALERAIAINSNYGEAYLRLGAAHEYAGRPREALAAYDQVMALDPLHTVLHVRRCLTLQNLGRYAEAEQACDRAIELQPEIPNALWARGLNAFAQGNLPAAIRGHEQALARAPHRADIRSELVLLLLDAGLEERARQELEVARRQAGGRVAEVALTGARLDLATGAFERIPAELRALDPGHADRRMRLDAAHLAFAAGDRELAARLRDEALAGAFAERDLYPDVYAVRWGVCGICALGLLERTRGDAAGAERYLNQVAGLLDELERNGHRWHGLEYLRATLQAQRGREAAALASLERAYRMGWRRAWLMRAEPAFAAMRDDKGFQALLVRIDAANAQARGILSAQTPTR
jgi:tetratricopeptide (TPR) repeat protein